MKYFFVFVAALCCMASYAGDIFREGTRWEVKEISTTMGITHYDVVYSLEGTELIGGRECMKLWKMTNGDADTKVLKTCLYTEGDKVFFIPRRGDTEGTLLYDFGLREGECTTVGLMNQDWDIATPTIMVGIRCAGRDIRNCGDKDYDVMLIEENHGGQYRLSGEWFSGLGSACGLSYNAYMDADGAGGILQRITNGDDVYFSVSSANPPEYVENVVSSLTDDAYYTLFGRPVTEAYYGIVVQRGGRKFRRK